MVDESPSADRPANLPESFRVAAGVEAPACFPERDPEELLGVFTVLAAGRPAGFPAVFPEDVLEDRLNVDPAKHVLAAH